MIIPYAWLILYAWLFADLLTGIFHWFEDRYMTSHSLNFLDSLAAENDLHHRKPTAMLASSGWTNMKSSAAFAWPLAFVLWLFNFPFVIYAGVFFAGFGNLIHRWSHFPERRRPGWMRFMQWIGLFISPAHHDAHHRSMKQLTPKELANQKFCGMTDWLNPSLDRLGVWPALESVLSRFGIQTTESMQS